jgi:anti-sigma regulatory factor (Ser/Thr protein kinase)
VETWGQEHGDDARRAATAAQSWPRVAASDALLDRLFGREEITEVRHEVAARTTAAGLTGDRLHGFVLAVNEVITNVVLHAGGRGRLILWVAGGVAHCAVVDSGPGIPDRLRSVPSVPATSEVGGRGIWLAYQLCDVVTMSTGSTGTTIELRIGLPAREAASDLVDEGAPGS